MKWITLIVVFLTATTAFGLSETVTTQTRTDGVDDHRAPDFCRTNPNPYTKESCEQIRQSERVRNDPTDPNKMTNVIQKKTVEPSYDMPAWQQALQPPATTTATTTTTSP